ncbi:MAG: hypothetical protein IJ774_15015 [Selenomonadaceae bacterium]|nr:hypothetical protein [Selenomonadaceae bacterium]
MADKQIKIGALSIENVEVDGSQRLTIHGTGSLKITTNKKSLELVAGTGKKSEKFFLEDHSIFNGTRTAVSLIGAAGEFDATESGRSKIVTVNASQVDGEIELSGNSKANVLIAGDENSTLDGGKGNDTLTGGDGSDIFRYVNGGGNDLIRKFDATVDKIEIVDAAVTDVSVGNKKSVVFTVGKGKLTVEGAGSEEFSFTDGDGTKIFKDGLFYSDDKTSVTVPASFGGKSKISVDAAAVTIDASAAKKSVNIVGNSNANSIVGGLANDSLNGDAGNDTLDGGKGNDKLWGDAGDDVLTGGKGNDSLYGGDGDDTFIYKPGDGNDVIFGFDGGDMLQIDGTFNPAKATVGKNGKELTLKIGAGSVTFKNFTADTFDINGTEYQIVASGKNKWTFTEASSVK